ncbi:hypothetical protein BC936DRAFT_146297 [Jimgerdemannia flammicorona]|uniref:Uncharacterized protein n=2 Tax=Jimgerdemannia flammicorona TaxID=994334 RepID=A0A433QCN4_9FUNG|nr:hypothetical protein BC936DRAFT_146297 [Jimgerdemannia flammicorona]RUS27537.1 hypothetical protein BC938DRAFT_483096 [Jimgerdemannia flammicorona]
MTESSSKTSSKRSPRPSKWTPTRGTNSKNEIYPNLLSPFPHSHRHQRGRSVDARCPSGPAPHDGEVHGQPASRPVLQFDKQDHRAHQVQVPARQGREAGARRGIVDALQHVAKREGFKLPKKLAQRVAELSDRNLRKALLMLEAAKVQK